MNEHLLWWKKTSTPYQYTLIKQYIDHSSNGLLSSQQQQQIKKYLGDTPQTMYFIGRVSFHLETKDELADLIDSSTEHLRNVFEFKEHCEAILEVLSDPFPEYHKEQTSKQQILSQAFSMNWEHRHKHLDEATKLNTYIDIDNFKKTLSAVINNCEEAKRNPLSEQAKKRRGNRRDINLEEFNRSLVSDFWTIYRRYPKLSENSDDFEAIEIIYDSYGYNVVDRLKEIKKSVKRSKLLAKPPRTKQST